MPPPPQQQQQAQQQQQQQPSPIRSLAALSEATEETEAQLLDYTANEIAQVFAEMRISTVGQKKIRRQLDALRKAPGSQPKSQAEPGSQPQPRPQSRREKSAGKRKGGATNVAKSAPPNVAMLVAVAAVVVGAGVLRLSGMSDSLSGMRDNTDALASTDAPASTDVPAARASSDKETAGPEGANASAAPMVYLPRFPKKPKVQPAENPGQPTQHEQQLADKLAASVGDPGFIDGRPTAVNVVKLLETGSSPDFSKSPHLFPMALKKYLFEMSMTGRPKEFATMIELMLEGGADPETPLGSGLAPSVGDQARADMRRPLPPLWFAVEWLHIDLVAILLHYGAYPSAWSPDGTHQPGQLGWSPLQSLAVAGRGSANVGQHMLRISATTDASELRMGEIEEEQVGALVLKHQPSSFSGNDPEIQTGQHQLWLSSTHYRQLARKAAEGRLLAQPLQELINAEGSVVTVLLKMLLDAGLNLARCISLTNTLGHNALHTAAAAGNVAFVNGVAAAAATGSDTLTAEDASQLGRALNIALASRDSMGRTPWHHAAMYGNKDTEDAGMQVFSALETLSATMPALGAPSIDMGAVCAPDKHGHDCDAFSASRQPPAEQRPSGGGWTRKVKNGGWKLSSYGEALYGTERCDVDEIVVLPNWQLRDLHTALRPYIVASKPAVVRGGVRLLKGLESALTKPALIKAFGKRSATVGPIPYHDAFEIQGKTMPLKKYIKEIEADAARDDGPAFAEAGPSGAKAETQPMYLFSRQFLSQNERLNRKLAAILDAVDGIDGVLVDRRDASDGGSADGLQFFLGGPGTGAPFHWHHSAVNALAYGRKRWFLLPKGRAIYATQTPLAYLEDNSTLADGSWAPLELVQEAGDLVFVPHAWAHQTLNIEASVGVAYETWSFRANIDGELLW